MSSDTMKRIFYFQIDGMQMSFSIRIKDLKHTIVSGGWSE